MNFRNLLLKNRSYRKFFQNRKIETRVLKAIIGDARIIPSAANLQPLKYVLVNNPEIRDGIFPHLKWAAYLKDWGGPEEGERPAAYIVMLGNRKISPYLEWDFGIALQTIMLSLTYRGLGSCAIAACDKKKIKELLNIPSDWEIGCVVALGKPREKVVIDRVEKGSIKYWRDEKGIHHVPKRRVEDLIFKIIE